jgi:pSer/pThr/pTyr-binding forkhead associated (FHA) protein
MSGVFCNQCGHHNPAGSNFCSSCGAALEVGTEHTVTFHALDVTGEPADEAVTVSIGELPEGLGLVVVKRGPNAGSKFVLDKDLTSVGRHPDRDIFLDDITVSRRHCEFVRSADGNYSVHDVGSLNGTYVNRERAEESVLKHGDEVQVGKFKLVFFSGGEG